MTGTAVTEAVEFEEIYKLKVVEIPTNKPIARVDEDDEIYKTEIEKFNAIVREIEGCYKRRQPVLVGTISIEKSEQISKFLKKHKLPHNILNAKYHEKEAQIIAQAGAPGAITIATNMAGRGTDIKLGGNPEMLAEKFKDSIEDQEVFEKKLAEITAKVEEDKEIVIEAGGMYILATERHESRRIDNQLRGRSGRQGDPGKSKFFLSLEDDLMRIFGSERLQTVLSTLGLKDDEAIFHPWITKTLAKAQNKVEARNYEIRKNLLKYDDIVNEQRKVIFEKRKKLIEAESFDKEIEEIYHDINQDIVTGHIPKNSYPEKWDIDGIENELSRIYALNLDIKSLANQEGTSEAQIMEFIDKHVEKLFVEKKSQHGEEIEKQLQKQIFLVTLDEEWKDHLLSLDKLRYGINLRAYAQKDPLIEYKRDAFGLFESMMYKIEEKVVSRLAHAQIRVSEDEEEKAKIDLLRKLMPKQQKTFETRSDPALTDAMNEKKTNNQPIITNVKVEDRKADDPSTWGNVGRNEKCPCGSGKKYKHCHGKVV